MSGIGTLINAGAIIAGGAAGLLAGNVIKERYQETLNMACSPPFISTCSALA